MIYLDYSATTPVDEEVLKTYIQVSENFIGNTNSLHTLGTKSNALLKSATNQISQLLNVNPKEVIYTSGATESNNLAIKGILNFYKDRGKHIVTTPLEHASVSETVKYLARTGYKVSYVNIDENGIVDLEDLKTLITDETVLVSIGYVNSEIGIVQNIKEIGSILKNYPKVIFHVDGTQAVGKIKIDLENIDLFSFSAHKIYGPKGIGCLIKKEHIELEPLFHGGKSNTNYRSGTPALPLIASFSKALRVSMETQIENYNKIEVLNQYLREELKIIEGITINSPINSIPHILNVSLIHIKPETFIHALAEHNIYISTQSACSNATGPSYALTALRNNEAVANTSVRISLSHKTTKEEVDQFFNIFKKEYIHLSNIQKRN